MNILVLLMYTLKINFLQILIHNSRNNMLGITLLDSPLYATKCDCVDGMPDRIKVTNLTNIPLDI